MNTALPEDIAEFAAVAAKRLARLGGPSAALRAETDDRMRREARAALSEVGTFDLDVRSTSDHMLAAAVLCQAAGATALPYPLVEELLAIDGDRLTLVNPDAPRIDHGDLPGGWVAADLDGTRYRPRMGSRTDAKLGPFLVPATLSEPDGTVPGGDVDLHLVLGSWRIMGAMQQCLEIGTEHVRTRVQFGKPLAGFQAVKFAVADASVAVRGLHELAKYTICRPETTPAQVRSADALVLRLKGRRHRPAGAAHIPSAAWGARFLRRVRYQRSRPPHPATHPATAQHRGTRPALDTRRSRWPAGNTVLRTGGYGMSTGPIAAGVSLGQAHGEVPFG